MMKLTLKSIRCDQYGSCFNKYSIKYLSHLSTISLNKYIQQHNFSKSKRQSNLNTFLYNAQQFNFYDLSLQTKVKLSKKAETNNVLTNKRKSEIDFRFQLKEEVDQFKLSDFLNFYLKVENSISRIGEFRFNTGSISPNYFGFLCIFKAPFYSVNNHVKKSVSTSGLFLLYFLTSLSYFQFLPFREVSTVLFIISSIFATTRKALTNYKYNRQILNITIIDTKNVYIELLNGKKDFCLIEDIYLDYKFINQIYQVEKNSITSENSKEKEKKDKYGEDVPIKVYINIKESKGNLLPYNLHLNIKERYINGDNSLGFLSDTHLTCLLGILNRKAIFIVPTKK